MITGIRISTYTMYASVLESLPVSETCIPALVCNVSTFRRPNTGTRSSRTSLAIKNPTHKTRTAASRLGRYPHKVLRRFNMGEETSLMPRLSKIPGTKSRKTNRWTSFPIKSADLSFPLALSACLRRVFSFVLVNSFTTRDFTTAAVINARSKSKTAFIRAHIPLLKKETNISCIISTSFCDTYFMLIPYACF